MRSEWVVLLPRLRAPELASPPPTPALPGWPGPVPERFARLYFGVEQCQYLQPTALEWQSAARWASDHELAFTAVTSPVTDAGLARLLSGLTALFAVEPGADVVFNDWGVYRAVHRRWPGVPLRIGRLLHRQMRDPRAAPAGDRAITPIWRETASSSRGFQVLLDDLGVAGVESDFPLHGLSDGALGDGRRGATLHLPWGCHAVGRLCAAQGLGRPDTEGFTPPVACNAPCRSYMTRLRAPWASASAQPGCAAARGAAPPELVEKGNSHFYRLGREQLADAYSFASRNPVARIAVSPAIPM